ncbi:MAG: hypothetical protein K5622_04460 [Endomicrobiaceae bacterium]|nr:hypothetical protein [Endomicrobiaceae bacterium]
MNKLYFRVLFFLSLMFVFSLAYANLRISPAVVNISADPMAVCENKYVVTNVEDKTVTVIVTKEDWKNYSGNDSSVTVDKWLELEKTKFDIGPKESVEVPFKVITDKNMVGSVSGMVVFTVEGGMIQLSMKQPIYIVIKGTEKVDFKIDSLTMATSERDGILYYNMTIKNDGNVHIRHNGVIEIYSKKTGNIVKTIDIEESFPTYAQDSRTFNGAILKGTDLEKGKYAAIFKIKAFDKQDVKRIDFKVSKLGEIVTK